MNVTRTPRTVMQYRTLLEKADGFYDELLKELAVSDASFDTELANFLVISQYIDFEDETLDFELAKASDTPEQIRAKFESYLDTTQWRTVQRAIKVYNDAINVSDPVTGPNAPEPDKKN